MSTVHASVLLVDRGDLPSLAAIVTLAEPSRVALWFPRSPHPASAQREAAARTHATLLDRPLVTTDPWSPPGSEPTPGLDESLELLQSVILARRLGCTRVIMPLQAGPDAEAIARTAERAATVGDLQEIDAGTDGIVLDLPLVDFDDVQVLDLVDDAGAPLGAFWPCDRGDRMPCGACLGCGRWQGAFETAGLGWPWAAEAVGAGGTERG